MKPTHSGGRSTILPLDFLDAELAAAPLAARSGLQRGLITLDAGLKGGSEQLWREIEPQLLSRFPGMSVDELVLRRDRVWFGEQERSSLSGGSAFGLLEVYQHTTRQLLTVGSGGRARLAQRSSTGLAECRRRWRWMTFALPPDLLLAAAGASTPRLDLLSPNLTRQLEDKGLAETHLHLKAAIDFPGLWASLQRAMADPLAGKDMFGSPGADFDEGRQLAPWLIRAVIVRWLLAQFLSARSGTRLLPWLKHRAIPRLRRRLGTLAIDLHLAHAVRDLARGSIDSHIDFVPLRYLYGHLTAVHRQSPPKSLEGVQRCDGIHSCFPCKNNGSTPEFRYLRAAFQYLSGSLGRKDPPFAKLFWQCVRLRIAFYRHVVQRPLTPGLIWFTRTYERLKPARQPLDAPIFLESAAKLGGEGLRALEVRITSEPDMASLKTVVEGIDQAARRLVAGPSELSEVGLVIHFPRYRGKRSGKGLLSAWGRDVMADPKDNPSGYRFGKFYSKQRFEAVALGLLLATFPRTLELIRGVDLCTDELAIPLWVMRPLVRHVRSAGELAARTLDQGSGRAPGPPRPAIRLTFHTGEDWVHLLGGLRRVGEVIDFLSMSEGDRLGHALALGTDPEAWAALRGRLTVTREERLLDLTWSWGVVSRATDPELLGWLPWLRSQLSRLSTAIFKTVLDPQDLLHFYQRLHTSSTLDQLGFPNGPTGRPRNRTEARIFEWIRSDSLFRRAQAIETVELEPEIELVSGLQRHVRRCVARLGITIESNPSSNLLIGHLGALASHPMWRLRPPEANSDVGSRLHLCIGSDDPITFATNLPEEYQLLLDSMVDAGLSTDEAEAWLDSTRQRGLTSRFTVPRSAHALTTPCMPAAGLPVLRP